MVDATRSMYAAGRGTPTDVVLAQLQATRLHADVVALLEHERTLRALLNALMLREPDAPLGQPPPLSPVDVKVDRLRLRKLQDERRPELAAGMVHGEWAMWTQVDARVAA